MIEIDSESQPRKLLNRSRTNALPDQDLVEICVRTGTRLSRTSTRIVVPVVFE